MYGADFDGNGGYDLIMSDRAVGDDGQVREYPHYQRKDTEKQLVIVKDRYPFHRDFGQLTMEQFLLDFPVRDLVTLRANYLRSAWIENLGGGDFALHKLPPAAQLAPLFATTTADINGDGYQDIVAVGNDYGAETGGGRLDALNGITLLFNPADKTFSAVDLPQSGLYVPGNGRSLVRLRHGEDQVFVAAENQGPTRAFKAENSAGRWYSVKPTTARLLLTHQDGSQSVWECYYGSGFLSQNSRQVWLPETIVEVKEQGFVPDASK
jgi:hypothetical protein